MSILSNRLAKLEAAMPGDSEPIHIARFIIPSDFEPIGYTCDGVEIIREPDESKESFHKRCFDAVIWPAKTASSHNFMPIRALSI